MAVPNRSLGLAALGWWLAARGLSEPIEESFTRLEATGIQRLGKASRIAALVATRRLARALRDDPSYDAAQSELFAGEHSPISWVDRLDTVLGTPRIGLKLEKALIGDSDDFEALIEVDLAENRSVMLAARLAEWLHSQLGADDEPAALATFLAQGWPIAEGAQQRITFLEEFLANLHAELADAPADVTMPLGEPEEFRAWLQQESGGRSGSGEPAVASASPSSVLVEPPPAEESAADAAEAGFPDEPSDFHHDEPIEEPPSEHRSHPVEAAGALEQPSVPRSRMGCWAIIIQLSWVALLIFGWRALVQRDGTQLQRGIPGEGSKATPTVAATLPPRVEPRRTTPQASATPSATASGVASPASSEASPTIAPLPQKPELSLLPDELWPQAQALVAAGHHAEAIGILRRITQIQAQDKSTGRLTRALIFARLASSLAALERWDEADAVVERAQALLEELLPAQDAETALGLEMVADYWASRERWPLAARLYQKAVQTYEGTAAENSAQELSVINRFAGALRQIGEVGRAERLYRQLVKGYEGAGNVVAVDAASASHNLANVLLTTNRPGEARAHYERALALLAKAPADDPQPERMAVVMRGNYERCLVAMGLSEEEARKKAQEPPPVGADLP